MSSPFERTKMLLGEDAFQKISQANIIVFGVGGVGGYVVEALVRSGISKITLVDYDTIDITNINRQIIANKKTIGLKKVDVFKERINEINDLCETHSIDNKLMPNNIENFKLMKYNYIIDAIDNISAKISLAEYCYLHDLKLLSCMGAGNKLDPMAFKITDIYKTKICPMARVMRRELKKRNVKKLKVCYSEENPQKSVIHEKGRNAPASVAFVPSAAGLLIASKVIQEIGDGLCQKKVL